MRAKIVVIEDEAELLTLLSDMLAGEGYEVLALGRPELVQTIDAGVRPDVFLIDLMLPGISGIEVAEQLRAGSFGDTPMIALSASSIVLDVAVESGLFQAQFKKPFEISAVLAAVHSCIEGRRDAQSPE